MSVLQTWVVVGVPAVVLAAGLLVGRSAVRDRIALAVLAALTVALLAVPGGGPSAAVVGMVAVSLVASGAGSARREGPEHHERRGALTRAARR